MPPQRLIMRECADRGGTFWALELGQMINDLAHLFAIVLFVMGSYRPYHCNASVWWWHPWSTSVRSLCCARHYYQMIRTHNPHTRVHTHERTCHRATTSGIMYACLAGTCGQKVWANRERPNDWCRAHTMYAWRRGGRPKSYTHTQTIYWKACVYNKVCWGEGPVQKYAAKPFRYC